MRQQNSNNSSRRARGRTGDGRNNRKSQPRNGVFDSNGPAGRIRGNANQVYDKYIQLARDARAADDRVAAESCYQFAEHYFRMMNDSADYSLSRPKPREESRDPVQEEQPEICKGQEGGDLFAEPESENGANDHANRGPRGRARGRGHRPRQDHRHQGDDLTQEASAGDMTPAEGEAAKSVQIPVDRTSELSEAEAPCKTDGAVRDHDNTAAEDVSPSDSQGKTPAASAKRPRGRQVKKSLVDVASSEKGSDS